MSKATISQNTFDTTKCQRCGKEVGKEKAATITFRNRTQTFCENCFKSVFKYDESLRTVFQIYEQLGRKTPFVIRSNNWHRSSYMVVKSVKSDTPKKDGNPKTVFVGDFYLRGALKEQEHAVGKANHFLWTPWSAEEAAKYKEEEPAATATTGQASSEPGNMGP